MNVNAYSVYAQSSDTNLFRNQQRKISAICSFGNLVFLGTHDGHILQVVFEEIEEQCTCFSYCVIFQRRISENAISRLQASQHAELVVVLSASKLNFFDAEKLELSNLRSSIDGVSTFSLSDSPLTTERHAMLAVCGKNQALHVFRVVKSRIDLVNTISLPSVALAVNCSDSYALFATSTKYFGADLKTRKCFEILDRTGNREQPLIESISEDEFLFSGPGSLGIFVKTDGQSERPPITLSANLFALFCRNQLVFAVDDEFVSIYCASLQKQVQTLVVRNACAACMSLNRDMIFVASSAADGAVEISVVRPETWDLKARRFILAGCLADALALLDAEYAKLVELCSRHQATSTGAKNIFNVRSKRVYTLMGMYHFEVGQFEQCREFFEKSSLDIRELLCRYVDLLPRSCDFTADPLLHIAYTSHAQDQEALGDVQPALCNIFDLSETSGVSVKAFREFLLRFLLENRRGRIFDRHTKLVETAILKLYVQLSEGGNGIYRATDDDDDDDVTYSTWEDLVASLSSVDVEDLMLFLEEHRTFHVRALLSRWNGDVVGALEIWKRLAVGELTDAYFPGPEYYVDALYAALISPYGPATSLPSNDVTGSAQYADIVAHHLEGLLFLPQKSLIESLVPSLLSRLACITAWTGETTTVSTSASSFPLAPASLLKLLLPHHPGLAEHYLWYRVFSARDKDPSRHILLAELQMQLLLKYAEENDSARLNAQRRRFRRTLFELEDCQSEKLLETLNNSPLLDRFTEEYVTLLGKLKKYGEALEMLLAKEEGKRGLEAALRFCGWCASQEVRQLVAEQSAIWMSHSADDGVTKQLRQRVDDSSSPTDAYTVLLKLMLGSKDEELLKQAVEVLGMDIPSLDFVEVCRSLPEHWSIHGTVGGFLRGALKRTAYRVSTTDMEKGLTTRLAAVSRREAAAAVARGLSVSETSVCAQCHQPIAAFGPQRPFAWMLASEQKNSSSCVVHLHCLKADSQI